MAIRCIFQKTKELQSGNYLITKRTVTLDRVRFLNLEYLWEERKMETIDVSLLDKNLYNSINNVIKFDDVIKVKTKTGNVVIISESKYKAMLETIYLNSQMGLVGKIKEGEKENLKFLSTYNPNKQW